MFESNLESDPGKVKWSFKKCFITFLCVCGEVHTCRGMLVGFRGHCRGVGSLKHVSPKDLT